MHTACKGRLSTETEFFLEINALPLTNLFAFLLKVIYKHWKSHCIFLTLCLLVSSADSLYKQFGPRSGPTQCLARSGSKLFDTLMVLVHVNPERTFGKVYFEKKIS